MNQHETRKKRDSWLITAVAFGGFLIVLAIVFVITPEMLQKAGVFISDLTLRPAFSGDNIVLPAPSNPGNYTDLYTAIMQFDIGIGILQIMILALRLQLRSPIGRISETVGNLIFWFGAAYLVNVFLLAGTLTGWFAYWAALIIVVGISLIARGLVHLAKKVT